MYIIMTVRDFVFVINNKKVIIFGSTPSTGQVVYSWNPKSLILKMEKNIGESLEFWYWSYLVNLHISAKIYGSRSDSLKVTRKTAKSKTVDLENKGQVHLGLPFSWSSMI